LAHTLKLLLSNSIKNVNLRIANIVSFAESIPTNENELGGISGGAKPAVGGSTKPGTDSEGSNSNTGENTGAGGGGNVGTGVVSTSTVGPIVRPTVRPLGSTTTTSPKPNVEGTWTAWSTWGKCQKTCGPGTRSKYRFCKPGPNNEVHVLILEMSLRVITWAKLQPVAMLLLSKCMYHYHFRHVVDGNILARKSWSQTVRHFSFPWASHKSKFSAVLFLELLQ